MTHAVITEQHKDGRVVLGTHVEYREPSVYRVNGSEFLFMCQEKARRYSAKQEGYPMTYLKIQKSLRDTAWTLGVAAYLGVLMGLAWCL